jgi:hypothetical protein
MACRVRPGAMEVYGSHNTTMAHELTPKPENLPLPFDEVIRRLRGSFIHVELDDERASEMLSESARHMARIQEPHFNTEDIERERQSIGRASYVVIADDRNADLAYLSFILEPEHEKIFIDYESRAHEEMSAGLRERLARILDYEMELV